MNTALVGRELDRLVAVPGVRAAIAATARDGLLVHAAGEAGADPTAVAALFAGLLHRAAAAAALEQLGQPRLVRVRSERDDVLAAAAGTIVLVVLALQGSNTGRIRLELLRAAGVLQ